MRCASFLVVRVLATLFFHLLIEARRLHTRYFKNHHSILQRHDGVHSAQYNQSQRNGNVHEQPEMKPVIQTLLLLKLPGFFAYVFQIIDGRVSARREQRAQPRKSELGSVFVRD
jgi:hypothetical protein